MSLQDRDYYRQLNRVSKHSLKQSNNPESSSGLLYLLYPTLVIALMIGLFWRNIEQFSPEFLYVYDYFHKVSGGIKLNADGQGQFQGIVLINNIPMPFLIDTGATITAIPQKLAHAAKLPVGRSIRVHTAGGVVMDRLTTISSIKIGSAEIKHVAAHINSHINKVLIGMNVLKYFRMTQSGNTMTLLAK